MHRRTYTVVMLLVLSTLTLAQYGPSAQSGVKLRGRSFSELLGAQKVLLSNYCRLDFEGVRLQPAGWSRFKPFTSLRSNPEFTQIVIVKRFDIENSGEPTELLQVNYQTVGFYRERDGYTTVSTKEQVAFRVQEQSGDLLITEINPETPHVSPRAAMAWMNLRLADPKTSELERAYLKDAIDQLTKSSQQPTPALTTPDK
jgi:hypothetical protein